MALIYSPNIYIKLPYDTEDNINVESLFNQFCAGSKQYNGVGFFYPKNEIEVFSNMLTNQMATSNQQTFGEETFFS